jgi:hypothetical protein
MARALYRLPPRAAATFSKPGTYSDGGGLYLRVTKQGTRQWIFIYQSGPVGARKRRELGLGSALTVTLAKARERAQAARDLLQDGKDPIAEAKADRAVPSFGVLADQWMAERKGSVRNSKSVDRWERCLGEDGYAKALRPMRVDEIQTDDVLNVLKPIWDKGPTATLARGYIEAVLDAATARKLRSGENPARWKGHLKHLLAKPRKLARGNHERMPHDDVPGFMPARFAEAIKLVDLNGARLWPK